MAAALLTIGAYISVPAVTPDDGPSQPPVLSLAVVPSSIATIATHHAPASATPEVVAAIELAPTRTPVPPPTDAPTEAPVIVSGAPAERVPAAQPALPPAAEEPSPPPPAGNFRYDMAGEIAALFNSVRSQNGLGPVSGNGSLSTASQAYVEYHYLNYGPYALSHTYDGVPSERATRAGYSWSYLGEVIASGGSSAQAFIDMWMNSGPHHDIILDGTYVDVGVGCYENVGQPILCVAMFGSPSG